MLCVDRVIQTRCRREDFSGSQGIRVFSTESFKGFDSSAFAAFEERKWSSNIYNIERMRVGELLGQVGDAVERRLAASDVIFGRSVTPHTPSVFNGRKVAEMALYFTRTDEQKRAIAPVLDRKVALPDQISDSGEYHRHGFLGLLIRHDRIDVGMMIHSRAWLDVMNLLNRCREREEEASKFVRMLHLLKPGAVVRVSSGKIVPAARFDDSMVSQIEEAVMNESYTFFVGFQFQPDDPAVNVAGFADSVAEMLSGLVDLWKFCAWKPTSNFLVSPTIAASHAAPAVNNDGTVIDFSTGSRVKLTGGLFTGRVGVVQDMDSKGTVKVLIGRVTVRTESHFVQAV